MTPANTSLASLGAPRGVSLLVFGASTGLLVLGLAISPRPVAQGWLIGFVIWNGVAVGSLVLLLIHRLTGGRWGDELAATLMRSAATLPLATLAFVPLAFGLPAPYRWAADFTHARPDVVHFYLNQPAFLARAFVALIGWTALALLLAWGRCNRLTAAIGLAFHGFIISLVAIDWILSIETSFGSSAFAAGIAVQQILAGLAFAALIAPTSMSKLVTADLAGLLMAALLGTVYIDLMSFIVSWYGDLPDKAAWYLRRGQDSWNWVILATVTLGAVIPIAMLGSRLRTDQTTLRVTGGLILLGVVLHDLWLMAPVFDTGAVVAAFAALTALTGLSIATADPVLIAMRKLGHDR